MTAGEVLSKLDGVMLGATPSSERTYPGMLHRLRVSAVRSAAGSIAIVLVTIFSRNFHLNATTVVPLYLLIIVFQALVGGVMTSSVVTAAAGACLVYFFLPPILSSRIDDPLDRLAICVFLAVSHVVTRLVSNASKTLSGNQTRLAPTQTAANVGDCVSERPSTAITELTVTRQDAGRERNCMRGSPIPDDIVYHEVSRIIASRIFKKSIRLRRLLEFIVDATVRGEAGTLKEWVIGTDVYSRGKDFDPRLDPIVRTEFRRLRRKLSEYFETEGRADPVVIEVPKGSYIPCFRDRCDDDGFRLPGATVGDYSLGTGPTNVYDTVRCRVHENISQ